MTTRKKYDFLNRLVTYYDARNADDLAKDRAHKAAAARDAECSKLWEDVKVLIAP